MKWIHSFAVSKRKLPQPMLYSYNLGSYWIHSLNQLFFIQLIQVTNYRLILCWRDYGKYLFIR